MIRFFVHGLPVSQGSTRAFVAKGRAHITNKTPGLDTWRKTIGFAAQPHAVMHDRPTPIAVALHFHLARPASLPKTRPSYATKRPDLDKLIRACLDALTGIFWTDDSQVVSVVATKGYAHPGAPIGVEISVGIAHEGFATNGHSDRAIAREGGLL